MTLCHDIVSLLTNIDIDKLNNDNIIHNNYYIQCHGNAIIIVLLIDSTTCIEMGVHVVHKLQYYCFLVLS